MLTTTVVGSYPQPRWLLNHDTLASNVVPRIRMREMWRVGDLVIWDNRATMHRARAFDDARYRRELRRVTTLDVEQPAAVTTGV